MHLERSSATLRCEEGGHAKNKKPPRHMALEGLKYGENYFRILISTTFKRVIDAWFSA